MRAMKDSGIEWIGQIPQEWDVRKIKHCFNVYAGATPKSGNSEFWDGDIVWVTPADYTTEQKYVCEGRKSITSKGFESCSTEMIPAGSLIFSKRAPIGLIAINTVDLCTNQGCLSCVPMDENDVEYFYYAFSCFTDQFDLYGSGTTFKEISADSFVNFPIPCPTIETQRKISEYLRNRCAEIDALIAAKEKTNALLKERRQSIIYEAVTKGLNPDAPMKDSNVFWIGHIPGHWDMTRLKFYATIRTGFTLGKRYDASEELQEYPYLRVANVQGEYTDLTNLTTIYMPVSEAEQYKLHAGELLMTEGGDRDKLGRGSVWHGEIPDCLHQNHVFALATKEQLNVEYLSYLTTSSVGRDYFDFTAKKTTNLASTNATTILEFKIPFPSREEQDQIVAFLNTECGAIDELMARNDDTIAALKEYRQSVIYEAVTGKIEV